jgi:hypothetical protein
MDMDGWRAVPDDSEDVEVVAVTVGAVKLSLAVIQWLQIIPSAG